MTSGIVIVLPRARPVPGADIGATERSTARDRTGLEPFWRARPGSVKKVVGAYRSCSAVGPVPAASEAVKLRGSRDAKCAACERRAAVLKCASTTLGSLGRACCIFRACICSQTIAHSRQPEASLGLRRQGVEGPATHSQSLARNVQVPVAKPAVRRVLFAMPEQPSRSASPRDRAPRWPVRAWRVPRCVSK